MSIVLEKFKDAPFVHHKLEHAILKEGVITGSAAFGIENNTDIDFILPYEQELFLKITKQCYLESGKYDYQESFSFYVKLRTFEKPVNIIFFCHKDLYDSWIIANNQFIKVLNESDALTDIIKDRKQRIAIFEGFRNAASISIKNSKKEI